MSKIKEVYEAVGGRKAVFFLLLIIAAIITIFFLEKDKFGEFMKYMSILYGTFCTGNTVGKLVNK